MEDKDPLSFDEVYNLYAQRIYYYCLSLVRNRALAEDLAAETFMSAYAAYPKKQPPPNAVHLWLFVIARNLVVDHLRKERRWGWLTFRLGQSVGQTGSIEQIAATNAELGRVLMVLERMKERDRKLIALRVVGELTNRDVAQVLGISESAAAAATQRALARFRALSEGQQ